jgi:hypothetical protein
MNKIAVLIGKDFEDARKPARQGRLITAFARN